MRIDPFAFSDPANLGEKKDSVTSAPRAFHTYIYQPQQEQANPLSKRKITLEQGAEKDTRKKIKTLDERLSKRKRSLGVEPKSKQEETAEEKMFTALNRWTEGALFGENREEAKKRMEEYLKGTSSTLDLSGLQLSTLPDIWEYPIFTEKLKKINLSGNALSKLPDSLNSVKSLKALNFFNVCNKDVPDIPLDLSNLQENVKLLLAVDAITKNSLVNMERVLATGLNINRKIGGCTLLMLASSLGFKDIVTVLVEKGGDLYAKNLEGRTAIRLAAAKGKEDIVTFLEGVMKDDPASSSFLFQHRLEHQTIINLLKPLYGDKVNEEGICYGFAVMGIQAILSGHIEQFNQRMEDLALFLKECNLSGGESAEVYKAVIEKLEAEKNIDLLAFLEGIQVCVTGGVDYPSLFSEGGYWVRQASKDFIQKALSIVGSEAFRAQGALLDVPKFTGVYGENDLMHYFSSLENVKLEQPITLLLGSRFHAITVGYDSKEKHWVLIGANNIFSRTCASIQELVENMEMEFGGEAEFSDGTSVMSAKICVMAKDRAEEKAWLEKIQAWQESEEFTGLHSTQGLSQEQKIAWLQASAEEGDSDSIQTLLTGKMDIDALDAVGSTALCKAVENGHLDSVQVLIENGADVNKITADGFMPLYIAAQNGDLAIVQALVDAKADVNKTTTDGYTALDVATTKGYIAVCNALRSCL